MSKTIGSILILLAGLVVGATLAFGLYASLEPSARHIVLVAQRARSHDDSVRMVRASQHKQSHRDSVAKDSVRRQALLATKKGKTPKGASTKTKPTSAVPGSASQASLSSSVASVPYNSIANTPLKAIAAPAPALLAGRWGQVLAGLALALVGVALWQFRRGLPPPESTSQVLEALFELPSHRRMLQDERLGLRPRQVKRFISKARIQNRQLHALAAKPGSPFAFLVWRQVQAFQLLLLLEADREGPQHILHSNQADFVRRLQQAYAACLEADLREAEKEVRANPVTAPVVAAEGSFLPGPEAPVNAQLMQQLYEMNTGLLA